MSAREGVREERRRQGERESARRLDAAYEEDRPTHHFHLAPFPCTSVSSVSTPLTLHFLLPGAAPSRRNSTRSSSVVCGAPSMSEYVMVTSRLFLPVSWVERRGQGGARAMDRWVWREEEEEEGEEEMGDAQRGRVDATTHHRPMRRS